MKEGAASKGMKAAFPEVAGKGQGNRFNPRVSSKELSHVNHTLMLLASGPDLYQTSDLQKCKKINLCSLNPRCL